MIHKRITKHRFGAKKYEIDSSGQTFLTTASQLRSSLTMIEEITNQNMTKEKIRDVLMHREDFWILKLDTLQPNGFNEDLNYPLT